MPLATLDDVYLSDGHFSIENDRNDVPRILAVIRSAGLDTELDAANKTIAEMTEELRGALKANDDARDTIRQLRQESDDMRHQIDVLRAELALAENNADFALGKRWPT